MIESFKDLKIEESTTFEDLDSILKDKLGICSSDMVDKLSEYLLSHIDEIASSFVTLAPFGNYSKSIEDIKDIFSFIKNEASKKESWKLYYAQVSESNPSLMEFVFHCLAINDGEELKGYVYISKSGKIRHAFAQVE